MHGRQALTFVTLERREHYLECYIYPLLASPDANSLNSHRRRFVCYPLKRALDSKKSTAAVTATVAAATKLTCAADTRRVSLPAFSGNFPMDLVGSAE